MNEISLFPPRPAGPSSPEIRPLGRMGDIRSLWLRAGERALNSSLYLLDAPSFPDASKSGYGKNGEFAARNPVALTAPFLPELATCRLVALELAIGCLLLARTPRAAAEEVHGPRIAGDEDVCGSTLAERPKSGVPGRAACVSFSLPPPARTTRCRPKSCLIETCPGSSPPVALLPLFSIDVRSSKLLSCLCSISSEVAADRARRSIGVTAIPYDPAAAADAASLAVPLRLASPLALASSLAEAIEDEVLARRSVGTPAYAPRASVGITIPSDRFRSIAD